MKKKKKKKKKRLSRYLHAINNLHKWWTILSWRRICAMLKSSSFAQEGRGEFTEPGLNTRPEIPNSIMERRILRTNLPGRGWGGVVWRGILILKSFKSSSILENGGGNQMAHLRSQRTEKIRSCVRLLAESRKYGFNHTA